MPVPPILTMSQVFIPGTNINILTKEEDFKKVDVSPELARWFLKRSNGNQVRVGTNGGIRPSHLKLLKGIIARGEWKATHQGGAVDWNGMLFDGHHRLTAIAEQTETLPMWFKIGCDPAENMAVDQGAVRTTADTLQMDKRETEVLRLAGAVTYGWNKPTPLQIEDLNARIPLVQKHRVLIAACPTTKRFFTCTPLRLAACARMLEGASEDYVLQQWRALVLSDYDSMSKCSKALTRQFMDGRIRSVHTYDVLARGLVVFDESRSEVSKIQVNDPVDAAKAIKAIIRGHAVIDSLIAQ